MKMKLKDDEYATSILETGTRHLIGRILLTSNGLESLK